MASNRKSNQKFSAVIGGVEYDFEHSDLTISMYRVTKEQEAGEALWFYDIQFRSEDLTKAEMVAIFAARLESEEASRYED